VAFFVAMQVFLSSELARRKATEKLNAYLNVPVEIEEAEFHPIRGILIRKVRIFRDQRKR